jgi:phage gp36-like protein
MDRGRPQKHFGGRLPASPEDVAGYVAAYFFLLADFFVAAFLVAGFLAAAFLVAMVSILPCLQRLRCSYGMYRSLKNKCQEKNRDSYASSVAVRTHLASIGDRVSIKEAGNVEDDASHTRVRVR